ncbi:MAG: DEAD/DEAH box helicase [Candidatus Nanohaloarchaea archaeon]
MAQLLKTGEIESRTYQEVIAAESVEKNTLVVLPTGLGKTVIAAMVAARKAEEGKVMFLAPTKPLAEQHLKTFYDFLEVPEIDMALMTGETRPERRYELWREKRFFFATPQVVENDLISDEIPTGKFSLVIFDEAHRATGDYSYVFISEKMRTHKLGLTASPGGDREKIEEVAENLQIENYEVRTEDDPDVEPYIEEKEVEWIRVSLNDRFEKAKQKLENAYQKQLEQVKKAGQLDSTSNIHKGELLKLRGEISSKLSSSDDPKLYRSISCVAAALKISQAMELLETQGVTQCYRYIQGLQNDDSKAASRALKDEDFQEAKSLVEYLRKKGEEHPKLEKLREILGDMEEGEKAIVFTEYRDSTERIAEELNTEGLNAVKFVGQQGERGMTQNKQSEILEAFEQGKFNVIVSTSIGEEGLDIPAVDYVVFYEPVPSEIRDIQRAGRTGRQEAGKVFVLIAEDTRDEGHYWSAHNKKKKMNQVLEDLKNDTRDLEKQQTLEGFSDKNDLVIISDDRETSISKKLSKKEVEVRQNRLDVADFLVSERTAVERKKASDFVDSIVDNRLFSQLSDLHQFGKPLLIIEGRELYSQRDMHPNSIRGAIASITIDHEIPIIWSEDEEDTAEILVSLARREQEQKNEEVAIRGSRTGKTERDLQEFIVAGLPEVNTKIAERLLEEFGSVEQVFSASKEGMKEVRGIGEKKAERIRSLIEKEYE